jgi:hypothetical protein
VVLFEEVGGARWLLQVQVGPAQARAIGAARRGWVSLEPLGLRQRLGAATGHRLVMVVIGAGVDGDRGAVVVLDDGGRIAAEVPDAVLLALTEGVPITAEDDLLGAAGGTADPAGGAPEPDPAQWDLLTRFRQFLDHVEADDFAF